MSEDIDHLLHIAKDEGHKGMGWTDTRIAVVKQLWALGHSASRIATTIGSVTRNAVIGKVGRLKLPSPSRTAASPPAMPYGSLKAEPARKRKPPKPTLKVAGNGAVFHACAPGPESTDLPNHDGGYRIIDPGFRGCRWPIGGEGADTRFCCHPKEDGSSYCPDHRKRGVQTTGSAKELARSLRRHIG